MVLRSAAVRRTDGGAPQRLIQALELVPTLAASERLPPKLLSGGGGDSESAERSSSSSGGGGSSSGGGGGGGGGEAAYRLLRGEWLLGFTAKGDSITFAPPDAMQHLGSSSGSSSSGGGDGSGSSGVGVGAFERLEPSGMGLVRTAGTFGVKPPATKSGTLKLELEIESRTLGPLPLPIVSRASEERVLLLDRLMCVTMQPASGGYAVWVRPTMQSTGAPDDEDDW